MLEPVENIFKAAQAALEDLKDGERMQVKDLAKVVGLAVAQEPKQILGFVNYFAHNTNIAYVTRGKNGGVVKGTRTVKPVKVAKVKPAETNTDSVSE